MSTSCIAANCWESTSPAWYSVSQPFHVSVTLYSLRHRHTQSNDLSNWLITHRQLQINLVVNIVIRALQLTDRSVSSQTCRSPTQPQLNPPPGLASQINYPSLSVSSSSMNFMHGHRSRGEGGGTSPPEFGAEGGGLFPQDFVMLQNFKHKITCITM